MSVADIGPQEHEFERTPPHDISAEQGVLGGMLLSQDAIAEVVELLRTPDFYRPAHQIIYDVILDLYGRGDPADAVTVAGELTKNGEIARIGGAPYLHTLISLVPTAANAGYYAKIVHERAILRRLVETGTRIVQMGYAADGADADEVLDRAQAEVFAIAEKRAGEDYVALSEIMPGALDEIEAIGSRGGQMVGCPTGFADLDALTNGLHPGQMIVVAARPAMGKALGLDTPLPTPSGWTTMGEVSVGDHLIGADGRPTRVVAATDVMHDRPCYEIEFSDGEVIVADAEHQWRTSASLGSGAAAHSPDGMRPLAGGSGTARGSVSAKRGGRAGRLGAESALNASDAPPFFIAFGGDASDHDRQGKAFRSVRPVAVTGPGAGVRKAVSGRHRSVSVPSQDRLAAFTGRPRIRTTEQVRATLRHDGRPVHTVDVAAAFDLPEAELPVDPYVLGVLLGAGEPGTDGITCLDREVIAQLEATGAEVVEEALPGCYLLPGTARRLGPSAGRGIPAQYMRASAAQRRALLAGLLDVCGHVGADGRVDLAFPSARLAGEVHELILSLGHRAELTTSGSAEEAVHEIAFTPAETVFRLPRKAARQPASVPPEARVRYVVDVRPVGSVPVRCVQVDNDDHMYLAGRHCVPTHNSTLALDFARAASIKHGLTSAFFSLEMGRNEITMRLLSAEARVALHAMRSGTMQDEDWTRLARRMSEVAEAPLFIDDSPNMSMMEIRAKCRRLKQQHDLRLVIIDYLQLMTSGKRVESRQVEVSEFSRSLKLLAKELGVPVIALSQLNRGPEQRTDKKPMVSDLRESGSIEQDADMVILLHREDAYEKESPRAGEADLIVAKHRNGPTATVTVAFQGHYSRFVDMAQ
ncbi:replicative DNA helicase [Actinomadura meyerae]|uniref:Replicative DNA helicase n=1 Tax=Actinomadura meyerae TaxID=240840 RepID=A0A239KUS2_9ACTN|nr:replicative DNA helicase [Actinomadura meyerae]SNT21961.1 replicative DNA helicase [Actinomadura meyerae]